MRRLRTGLAVAVLWQVATHILAAAPDVDPHAVDPIFSSWTADTPGCAVSVSRDGKPVLARAYGSADLEHGIPNTPETVFEAGSVSKQFTVLAVQLLASEGKLSLDDPVRKYIPELPDYGVPLTIRNMLNHTSGLRDWGSVESIAGWPRTTRVKSSRHWVCVMPSGSKIMSFVYWAKLFPLTLSTTTARRL